MDQFSLFKKWFWVGIAVAFFDVRGGLVYGLAMLADKNHRQEGLIIITFTLAWFSFALFVLSPWLIKSGLLPSYRLLRIK